MKIILLILVLTSTILFTSACNRNNGLGDAVIPDYTTSLPTTSIISQNEIVLRSRCQSAGGSWRQYENYCSSLCNFNTCETRTANSCDCGPNKCWDEISKCMPIY